MDFTQIKKWMKKMDVILEVYASNEDFTQTEKNLLLDYIRRIEKEIQLLKIQEEHIPVSESTFIASNPIPKVQTIEETKPVLQDKPVEKIVFAETQSSNTYEDLFDHLVVSDLSVKLEMIPIKDLNTGLGLNEKILAQNELFNNDKSAFSNILNDLNSKANFNEARSYLCENVIPKYRWTDPAKLKNVESFLKLIYRRFL